MEYDPVEILDDEYEPIELIELDEEAYLEPGEDEVEFLTSRAIHQLPPEPSIAKTNIGDSVQFNDGSFMRIIGYDRSEHGQNLLRGYLLYRPTVHTHCMDSEENELVWQQHFSDDWSHIHSHQTRLLSDVNRNCQIIFTNQLYKVLNYSSDLQAAPGNPAALFFCRWKRVLPPVNKLYRKEDWASRHQHGKIEHLRAVDADDGHRRSKHQSHHTKIATRIPDSHNRTAWREDTILGGSGVLRAYDSSEFRQYTIGDCFSGAGGTSEGAYAAGLNVKWAFDFNRQAMSSYENRFGDGGTKCLLEDCTQFLKRVRANPEKYKVDIVHLSPPCKPFSAANTTPNEETNAINHAVFTVVEDIIREIKPRVVTLEQANALEWPSRREWFVKVLSMFTGLGYSVNWEVVDLSCYGVPQSRSRLIMVGSCPGEKLPPLPTHTDGTGIQLYPAPSIHETMRSIPHNAPHHEVAAQYRFPWPRVPLDGSKISGTIKCGGNSKNVYFPNGTRGYDVRELASLQTFPNDFIFMGSNTQKMEQIGNAVPPRAAMILFLSIRTSLLQADREYMQARREEKRKHGWAWQHI